MKHIIFFLPFFTFLHGQSNTGYDLLSDLKNNNKNATYTYWIGTVNGNIQGYEYGIWFALDYLIKNKFITLQEKKIFEKQFQLVLPDDFNEEDIFKVVWKYIDKNSNYRHMELPELTHIAIKNKLKKTYDK